jgi:hypothetical protein
VLNINFPVAVDRFRKRVIMSRHTEVALYAATSSDKNSAKARAGLNHSNKPSIALAISGPCAAEIFAIRPRVLGCRLNTARAPSERLSACFFTSTASARSGPDNLLRQFMASARELAWRADILTVRPRQILITMRKPANSGRAGT